MKRSIWLLAVGLLISQGVAKADFSYSTCAATTMCVTYCPSVYGPVPCGQYPVACQVNAAAATEDGGAATVCTYFWAYNQGVSCNGINSFGQWESINIPCH